MKYIYAVFVFLCLQSASVMAQAVSSTSWNFSSQCPPGWSQFGGTCFSLLPSLDLSAEEAAEACRASHPLLAAKLATFRSAEELQNVLSSHLVAPRTNSFTLGLVFDVHESLLSWSHGVHLDRTAWPIDFDPYIEEKCVAAKYVGDQWRLSQTRCSDPKRAGVCSAPLFIGRKRELLASVVSASNFAAAAQRCAEHSGVLSSDLDALRQAASQNSSWSKFWLGHTPVHHPSSGWSWQRPGQSLASQVSPPSPPSSAEQRLTVSSASLAGASAAPVDDAHRNDEAMGLCVAHDTVHHRPDRCPAGWVWFASSDVCVYAYDQNVPQLDAATACTAHQAELWLPALHGDVDAWLKAQNSSLWTAAAPSGGGSWGSVYTGEALPFSVLSTLSGIDGVVWSRLSSTFVGRVSGSLAKPACVRPAGNMWQFHKLSLCPYGWIPLEGQCVRSSHSSHLATAHTYADAQRQCGAWGGTVLATPQSKLAMAIAAAATWINTGRNDVFGLWLGIEHISGAMQVSGFPGRDPCAAETASLWQSACSATGIPNSAAVLSWSDTHGLSLSLQAQMTSYGFLCSMADTAQTDTGCPAGWLLAQGTCYRADNTVRQVRHHAQACSTMPEGSYIAPLPSIELWELLKANVGALGAIASNVLFGMRRAGVYPVEGGDRLAPLPGTAAAPRVLSCVPMRQTWITSSGQRIGRAAWAGAGGTGDPPTGVDDLQCSGGHVDHADRNMDVFAYVAFDAPPYELHVADASAVGSLSTQALCARKPRSAVLGVTDCPAGWTEAAGKCVQVINDNILFTLQAAELITKHCASQPHTAVLSPRGYQHQNLFSSGLLSFLLSDLVTVGVTNRFSSASLSNRPDVFTTADGYGGGGALLWANEEPRHNRGCTAVRISNDALLEDVRCGDGDGTPATNSIACERPLASPCPAGWQHLHVAGNVDGERTADRCYKAITSTTMGEPAARSHCQSLYPELGSDLVSLDSYWELYHVLGLIKESFGTLYTWVNIDTARWPLPGAADTGALTLNSANCALFRFTTSSHGYEVTPFPCSTTVHAVCEMNMPGGSFSDAAPPGVMLFPRCGEYGSTSRPGCGSDPWLRPSASSSPVPAVISAVPTPLPTPSVTPVSFTPTPSPTGTAPVSPSAVPSISSSPTAFPSSSRSATSAATVSSSAAATASSTAAVTASSTAAATASSTAAVTASSTAAATASSTAAATASSTAAATASSTAAVTASSTAAASHSSQPSGQATVSSSATPASTAAGTASVTPTPYVQLAQQAVTNTTLVARTDITLTVPAALIPGSDHRARLAAELRGGVVVGAMESALAACGAALDQGLAPTSVLGAFWAREAGTAWWWVMRDQVSVSCSALECWARLPVEMQLQAKPAPASSATPSAAVQPLSVLQRKVLAAHVLFAVIGQHRNVSQAGAERMLQAALPDGAVKAAAGLVAAQDPSAVLASGYSGDCDDMDSSTLRFGTPTWCSGHDEVVAVAGEQGQSDAWTNEQTATHVGALEASSAQSVAPATSAEGTGSVAPLGSGAIAGLAVAATLLVAAAVGLVWYQRRNNELQSQVQAASAKVAPSPGRPRAPAAPGVLKAAPPAVDNDSDGHQKAESARDALPVVSTDLSTSSASSEHTAVAVSPEQPSHLASRRLLSMPFDAKPRHGAEQLQAPFALDVLTEERSSGKRSRLRDSERQLRVDSSASTAGSSRTRPSVEALNMGPEELPPLPFAVQDAGGATQDSVSVRPPFQTGGAKGTSRALRAPFAAGGDKRTADFRTMNEFGVTLASETASQAFTTGASSGLPAPSKAPSSVLTSTRRYNRFPTRSLVASQHSTIDPDTAKAAKRLGLQDFEADYSSDSSGAGAYVEGQSSHSDNGRRSSVDSLPGAPFALGTARVRDKEAAPGAAVAELPAGVHVSMRYRQRKQKEAALNAALGKGGSVADTDSTTNLSTEIWTVSQASQVMQTHGRVSPFAPNLSGGDDQMQVPQLSLGRGVDGVAAASRFTMSSGDMSAEPTAEDAAQDVLPPFGSWSGEDGAAAAEEAANFSSREIDAGRGHSVSNLMAPF